MHTNDHTLLQVDACAAALALESQRGQPPQQEQQQQDQQSVEGNEHAAIEKASEQHTTTTVDPVAVAMLQLRAAHELKATQVSVRGCVCYSIV